MVGRVGHVVSDVCQSSFAIVVALDRKMLESAKVRLDEWHEMRQMCGLEDIFVLYDLSGYLYSQRDVADTITHPVQAGGETCKPEIVVHGWLRDPLHLPTVKVGIDKLLIFRMDSSHIAYKELIKRDNWDLNEQQSLAIERVVRVLDKPCYRTSGTIKSWFDWDEGRKVVLRDVFNPFIMAGRASPADGGQRVIYHD